MVDNYSHHQVAQHESWMQEGISTEEISTNSSVVTSVLVLTVTLLPKSISLVCLPPVTRALFPRTPDTFCTPSTACDRVRAVQDTNVKGGLPRCSPITYPWFKLYFHF